MRRALPLLALVLLLLPACSAPRRAPIPADLAAAAAIPGIPHARFWGDEVSPVMLEWLQASLDRERAALHLKKGQPLPDTAYLALSGGGPDGAFGAGLLCGWTQRGDRPAFRIVTGISTGALIAPFAFVGPDYDHVLREMYTSLRTKDIATSRGILGGLSSDALTDTRPLRALVAKLVDEKFLARVAEEYNKGRSLIVATTNMDAQRPVIWALGAIAASGHPDSLQLFRDVMVASAAIPGVFPPVMITVEADGRKWDEMHADGGVASQVFLYPAAFSIKEYAEAHNVERKRSVYVIRNARLAPEHKTIERRALPIAGRAIATLIKTQGVGDLYRIYLGCLRDDLDYNLAHIPDEFHMDSREAFDPAYMTQLFDLGYQRAVNGYPWSKAPPGFAPPEQHAEEAPPQVPEELKQP